MWRRERKTYQEVEKYAGAAATAATVTAAAAEKIMNRLIIQVISLNYLEDKINGFHVIARQRQINHISQHFPFFLLLFRSVPFFLFLIQLSSALLLRIQKLLSFWIYILKKSFFSSHRFFFIFLCIFRPSCKSVSCHLVVFISVLLSAGKHIH